LELTVIYLARGIAGKSCIFPSPYLEPASHCTKDLILVEMIEITSKMAKLAASSAFNVASMAWPGRPFDRGGCPAVRSQAMRVQKTDRGAK